MKKPDYRAQAEDYGKQIAAALKPDVRPLSKRACWKCGSQPVTDPAGYGGAFGSAKLLIFYADDSYSGLFEIDLCSDCITEPHNEGRKRL